MIDSEKVSVLSGNVGKLTVSSNGSEISTADINFDTLPGITSSG